MVQQYIKIAHDQFLPNPYRLIRRYISPFDGNTSLNKPVIRNLCFIIFLSIRFSDSRNLNSPFKTDKTVYYTQILSVKWGRQTKV